MRSATIADLEAIQAIVAEAYTPYIARMGQAPGPMSDDYAQHIVDGTIFLIDDAAGVTGLIVLLPRPDHLLLDNVAVATRARGRGVGRTLLDFAERVAMRLGTPELRLYTHVTMTENQAIYRAAGWEETGRGEQAGFQRVFFRKQMG